MQLPDHAADHHSLTRTLRTARRRRSGLLGGAASGGSEHEMPLCNRWRAGARLLLAALTVSVGACSAPPLPKRTIEGGKRIGSLGVADSALVLVIQPDQCFACGGAMEPWVRLQARRPGNVFIVLAGTPSAAQRRELAVRRIQPAGTLDTRWWWRERRAPPYVALVAGDSTAFERPLKAVPEINRLLGTLRW
jgi:hypothetical protein